MLRDPMSLKRQRNTKPNRAISGRFVLVAMLLQSSSAFIPSSQRRYQPQYQTRSESSSSLSSFWFGGSGSVSVPAATSDEVVPVRIERPSPSSRKIIGEIVAPVPLSDVWSILTDYDRLAMHVPNLKESRVTARGSQGQAGDGQYQCRLFQRGAQKIVGFEFGASVTMDMKESIVSNTERRISFTCADSFFFKLFDGDWIVKERTNAETGEVETQLIYEVLVGPRGPVPVAALEWRIREDVPTNLRAVKLAAGKRKKEQNPVGFKSKLSQLRSENFVAARSMLKQSMRSRVKWQKDETMAAYLNE